MPVPSTSATCRTWHSARRRAQPAAILEQRFGKQSSGWKWLVRNWRRRQPVAICRQTSSADFRMLTTALPLVCFACAPPVDTWIGEHQAWVVVLAPSFSPLFSLIFTPGGAAPPRGGGEILGGGLQKF